MNVSHHANKRKGAESGRGLLEFLIVAAIVVFLSVMLDTEFTTTKRNKGLVACQKNLETIYLAMSIYENDNNGRCPALTGATNPADPLSLLVPRDTTMTELFICPASKDPPLPEAEPFNGRKISYSYYMGLTTNDDPNALLVTDAQVDIAPKSAGQQIFSGDGNKPGNNHGKIGGNLITLGGQAFTSGPKLNRDGRYPPNVHLLNPE